MIKGTCLCRAVEYELECAPDAMNLCHCSMCRKVTGSAYGVFAHMNLKKFHWVNGEDKIQRYESSPGEFRAFCSQCGSNLPVCIEENSHVIIPAGSFDDDPQIRPAVQIFAGSKAPWHKIADSPPSFSEFEPDDFFD